MKTKLILTIGRALLLIAALGMTSCELLEGLRQTNPHKASSLP